MRRILLIEPKYKNKYPPIGLMKLASYHRLLGDQVEFFKGDIKDLIAQKLTETCIDRLKEIWADYHWHHLYHSIERFIKSGKVEFLVDIPFHENNEVSFNIIGCIQHFSKVFRKKSVYHYPQWDRIYVTTLFTFYWKVTVEAIHAVKPLTNSLDNIYVGGVLASLLQKELELETGIKSWPGLLDKPGILDPDNSIAQTLVIDNLPLDYSILEEVDYEYPTGSAYFTFMTKGCTRKCAFCSVPILEPTYKPKIETKDKFFEIKALYGEQQNLLLMDNNVLASPNFLEIIQEIKDMGFTKGATFVEPNQFEISLANLRNGINDKAYVRRIFKLLKDFRKRLKSAVLERYNTILADHRLNDLLTINKDSILLAAEAISPIYERYRSKAPRQRYVDFNQGTDARYVTDELMRAMSEIPIRPLRIAFDYWGMREQYEAAIRLAAKYGISELSNYILYNFKDKPDELYKRLEINVMLGEELNIHIYSFPMKYIPLFGEEAKDRNFIGNKWNRKFIRAIQSILNVTKGIVAPGRSFFERAFGKDIEEFRELLYMPEAYIVYRKIFEDLGLTDNWRKLFRALSDAEKSMLCSIIETNQFSELSPGLSSSYLELLAHYRVRRDDIETFRNGDTDYQQMKKQFDKMVNEDRFKNLTLTYDFERETVSKRRIAV